jgi:tetratricopeptide (TPR) repeat protein
MNNNSARAKQLMSRAVNARKQKDFDKCQQFCDSILRSEPNHYDALLTVAQCATETRHFQKAVDYGLQLIKYYPNHPNGAIVASVGLMNMGRNAEAVTMLEHQLTINPNERALLFNLHTSYSGMGNTAKAVQVSLDAVAAHPTDSDAYNNLGASLTNIGRASDAVIAFETATLLNPDNYTARVNLLNTQSHAGNKDEWVINEVQLIEKNAGNKITTRTLQGARHNAAFSFFRTGQAGLGWDYLEAGLSPELDSNRGRAPRRNFQAPRWRGEPITGKRLMVWREQGLGDEIMLASMLHELQGMDCQVVFECNNRLVSLFQRSFPEFEVRAESFRSIYPFDSPKEDFDYQIPLASLGGLFRRQLEDFKRCKAYFKTDAALVADYKARLSALAPGKKWIGLCWRSGMISPTRSSSYTLMEDWDELLLLPDVAVVNLQYGLCEDELLAAEARTGKTIIRWQDTDLQNDLEAVAALSQALHGVCSVGTAVAQIAGAAGQTTRLVCRKPAWTAIGTHQFQFCPDIHLVFDEHTNDMQDAVAKCIAQIADLKLG